MIYIIVTLFYMIFIGRTEKEYLLIMKKLLSLFLIVTMIFMLFIMFSCGKNDSGNANGNDSNAANNGEVADGGSGGETDGKVDKWAQEAVSFPDTDFGGREFNVVTVEVADANRMYDYFSAEEQTGDPIIDALYTRRLRAEEKFNVAMKTKMIGSPADNARKSILAGDNEYDLIVDTIGNVRNLSTQRLLADLYAVPYIKDDMDKPWWDQALIRDLSINGKVYFQAGNIVLRDKLRVSCMYFNKDMCKSLGLEYPYKYVYDGTWTIDKMLEVTKGVNMDLNGDGVMDQYDQWGFMSQHEFGFHLFISSGEKTITLNKDGVPEITINSQRAMNVIQKALEVCIDPVNMFHADTIKGSGNVWLTASEYFQEDRFLMRASVFEPIPRDLRAMPTDFGILPTVKFDESQENYYAYAEMSGLVIGIPMNADLEFSGLITEFLAYESGTTLMPAFYDLCLTSKVLRDDESEGMLDIIFGSRVYDIGYIYSIGNLSTILNELVSGKSTDFVSKFEKSQGNIEKALDKFIDSYGQA